VSRFADYTDNVARSYASWKYELIAPHGEILATSEPSDDGECICWSPVVAPLDFNRGGVSVRSARMTIPIDDARLLPRARGSLLSPEARNRVRLFAGIEVSGVMVWWPQGTLLVDTAVVHSDRGVAQVPLTLYDATSPLRSDLVSSFTMEEDEPVETVVERLLAIVFEDPASYAVTPTGHTVPQATLEAGTAIDDVVAELLEGCGHELTADTLGKIIGREIPPSGDTSPLEHWRYGQETGIPIGAMDRVIRRHEPVGYLVEGGSIGSGEAVIARKVFDTDPASTGYFRGAGEVRLTTARFTYPRSVPQMVAAGYGLLRRNGAGPGEIEFKIGRAHV